MSKFSKPRENVSYGPGSSKRVSSAAPRILLAATYRWPPAARLAIAFADAGCRVEAVCPRGQLVSRTTAVSRLYPYHGAFAPLKSFRRAIQRSEPDVVIPCDDLAVAHLCDIYESEVRGAQSSGPIVRLLERSFGAPAELPMIAARSRLMEIARAEGIVAPETATISTTTELEDWLDRNQLPAVLKVDGAAAGIGVRIVRTRLEAERAFKALNSRPLPVRVAKRAVVDRDLTLISRYLLPRRSLVSVQNFIPGRDATSSIACWAGEVLASFNLEVLRTCKPNGPASTVRVIDNPAMSQAAVQLARRLHLSGLYGLDFKIDATNETWLIEMNPRATQTSHLRLGPNGNLAGALVAALSGEAVIEPEVLTSKSIIALFPNEWQNYPASDFLESGYHDVPWSEPELVRACMKKQSWMEKWCTSERWTDILSQVDEGLWTFASARVWSGRKHRSGASDQPAIQSQNRGPAVISVAIGPGAPTKHEDS